MLCEDGPLELIVNSVVAKVDRFDWAISESGGTYKWVSTPLPAGIFVSHTCYPGCRRQVLKYSLVVEKFACTLPSTDTRIDLLILECTRVIQEKIMKHDSRQIKTVTPQSPKFQCHTSCYRFFLLRRFRLFGAINAPTGASTSQFRQHAAV